MIPICLGGCRLSLSLFFSLCDVFPGPTWGLQLSGRLKHSLGRWIPSDTLFTVCYDKDSQIWTPLSSMIYPVLRYRFSTAMLKYQRVTNKKPNMYISYSSQPVMPNWCITFCIFVQRSDMFQNLPNRNKINLYLLQDDESLSHWWFGACFFHILYWEESSQLTFIFFRGAPGQRIIIRWFV